MTDAKQRLPLAVAGLVVVAAFLGGMWISAHQRDGAARHVEGLLWPDPPAIPEFHLRDHNDRPFGREALRGHWSLLFFGFTNCPDVCPTALAAMAQAQASLRDNPRYGARGQIVFVSVDPARDTPAHIAEYVGYFAPDIVGVTGETADLENLTRALGVLFMRVGEDDENYAVDHSAGIFFVGPDLHLYSVLTPPQSAAGIVRRFTVVSDFVAARG